MNATTPCPPGPHPFETRLRQVGESRARLENLAALRALNPCTPCDETAICWTYVGAADAECES